MKLLLFNAILLTFSVNTLHAALLNLCCNLNVNFLSSKHFFFYLQMSKNRFKREPFDKKIEARW